MKYFDGFLDNEFGMDSLKERPLSGWIKTIDDKYYEEISSEIEFIRSKKVERKNKGEWRTSKIGELVYHLDSNEIIYYVLDLEGKRKFKIKQTHYLEEINPHVTYDTDDFKYHDDFVNNYNERAVLKKSNDILKRQPLLFDTQTNEEVDFCSLIMYIINKHRLGSAHTIEYWDRYFSHNHYEHDRIIRFQNEAHHMTSNIFHEYMKYGGKVDVNKAELIFEYLEFGSEETDNEL